MDLNVSDYETISRKNWPDEFETAYAELADPMDRFADAFSNPTDVEKLTPLLADDVVLVDWTHPGEVFRGKEAVVDAGFADIPRSTPDARADIKRRIRSGDMLILCGFFRATFTHDLPSYKATNKPVRWEFRDMFRFNGEGLVDYIWWANDTLTVKRMIGGAVDHDRFWT